MGTPGLNASIMAPKTISKDMPPTKQLTIFVTIQVDPSNIEKFKEAHRTVWKACSEEQECLFFDVFQDLEIPGRFRFVEIWSRSREWFEKELLTKPYYAALREESKPLWVTDIKMEFFERQREGSAWSDEYLAGRKKKEKTQVVA